MSVKGLELQDAAKANKIFRFCEEYKARRGDKIEPGRLQEAFEFFRDWLLQVPGNTIDPVACAEMAATMDNFVATNPIMFWGWLARIYENWRAEEVIAGKKEADHD